MILSGGNKMYGNMYRIMYRVDPQDRKVRK